MTDRRKFAADKEAILTALDQLSQTMDVMGQVIARLKRSVEQAQISEKNHKLESTQGTEKPVPSTQAPREETLESLRDDYVRKRNRTINNDSQEPKSKAEIVLH